MRRCRQTPLLTASRRCGKRLRAFTVTWFNPQAVIDGTLMLGAFRSSLPADTASLYQRRSSCLCPWFFGLTGIFKPAAKICAPAMQWINRICGAVIFFTPSNCFIPLGRCCKNNEYTYKKATA
ncbi:MAG: hypothetical protein ACLRXQ_13820 [Phascolarctobacterium faecium]